MILLKNGLFEKILYSSGRVKAKPKGNKKLIAKTYRNVEDDNAKDFEKELKKIKNLLIRLKENAVKVSGELASLAFKAEFHKDLTIAALFNPIDHTYKNSVLLQEYIKIVSLPFSFIEHYYMFPSLTRLTNLPIPKRSQRNTFEMLKFPSYIQALFGEDDDEPQPPPLSVQVWVLFLFFFSFRPCV
jgi:hypothetical protein